jgi:hypothetical protein
MNMILMSGVLLVFVGVAGLAVPGFTTQQTRDVARIGDLTIQVEDDTSHTVPPFVAAGALAAGIILIGFSLFRRR